MRTRPHAAFEELGRAIYAAAAGAETPAPRVLAFGEAYVEDELGPDVREDDAVALVRGTIAKLLRAGPDAVALASITAPPARRRRG